MCPTSASNPCPQRGPPMCCSADSSRLALRYTKRSPQQAECFAGDSRASSLARRRLGKIAQGGAALSCATPCPKGTHAGG
eukprot:2235919-Prymnesium_polylepis.1